MQKENSLTAGTSTPGGMIGSGSYTWHLSLRVDRPVEVRWFSSIFSERVRFLLSFLSELFCCRKLQFSESDFLRLMLFILFINKIRLSPNFVFCFPFSCHESLF